MGAQERGTNLWGGGIVPYEINPDLGNQAAVESAIVTFEQQTNLRFVQRMAQEDYIRFSKQTRGNANAKLGRQGGRQYVNASLNSVGVILHEIGHAVGMTHEHQREDRDDFVIFHEDRVTEEPEQYEKEELEARTEAYDFESLMHYPVGDPSNPVFESKTGIPVPAKIGSKGVLTVTDKTFLEHLYPAAPVIRRTDGEGGAGEVQETSSIAVVSVNNTAVVANAIRNGSGNYQVVLWRIRDNGVILRMGDPQAATGGSASSPRVMAVGPLFVSAMRDADGELLLITHDAAFGRLNDSGNQAGEVGDLDIVAVSNSRVMTTCISGSGRVLNIVWEIQPDGSVMRLFDSGLDGPSATRVSCVLLQASPTVQVVAILYADDSSRLVLSTWRVTEASVDLMADSGSQMGESDLSRVVLAPTGHLVVVCRDGDGDLLLIPFTTNADGADIARVEDGEGRAGRIRELAAIPRPYGALTAVISDSGNVLLIKWRIDAAGTLERLGESGTQAGEGSAISVTALPFSDKATVCTAVRNGSGDLLPITWDDVDGPGELTVV
jgi:astacin (peptidase family M12A)